MKAIWNFSEFTSALTTTLELEIITFLILITPTNPYFKNGPGLLR